METDRKRRVDEFFSAKKRRYVESSDSLLSKEDVRVQQCSQLSCDVVLSSAQFQAKQNLVDKSRQGCYNEVLVTGSANSCGQFSKYLDDPLSNASRNSDADVEIAQKHNRDLSEFANDFLSICCSGAVKSVAAESSSNDVSAHSGNILKEGLSNESDLQLQIACSKAASNGKRKGMVITDAVEKLRLHIDSDLIGTHVARKEPDINGKKVTPGHLTSADMSLTSGRSQQNIFPQKDELVNWKKDDSDTEIMGKKCQPCGEVLICKSSTIDHKKLITSEQIIKAPLAVVASDKGVSTISSEEQNNFPCRHMLGKKGSSIFEGSNILTVDNFESPKVTNKGIRLSFSSGKRKFLLTPRTCNSSRRKKAAGWNYQNSMFSPGDEFWNEAIHWADGLISDKTNHCEGKPTESAGLKLPCEVDTKSTVVDSHIVVSSVRRKQLVDATADCTKESNSCSGITDSIPTSKIRKKRDRKGEKVNINHSLTKSNKKVGSTGSNNGLEAGKIGSSPLPIRRFDFSSQKYSSPSNKLSQTSEFSKGVFSEDPSSKSLERLHDDLHGCNAPNKRSEVPMVDKPVEVCSKEAQNLSELSEPSTGVPHNKVKPLKTDVSEECCVERRFPEMDVSGPMDDVEIRQKPLANKEKDGASLGPSFNKGSVDLKKLDFHHWLPSVICAVYAKKGLTKLYTWQVECLQLKGVLEGRNLVYCASTSAGKSLVAEILMLRQVLSTGKKAFLVLPYVSICSEKAEHLELLLEPLGKKICSFFGTRGGPSLPKDACIAVCTIEKANSLINKLLEEGRLPELAVIVIDELHMVGDRDRGYLLELLLTKLRYAAGEGKEPLNAKGKGMDDEVVTAPGAGDQGSPLQIIGMSATMPNAEAVAKWLQAALYETEFRPVPLVEYLKVGNEIYNKDMEVVRTIRKTADLAGKDPDHIIELCNEVVQEGHSVLLFCSSRKACETSAKHVAKFLPSFSVTLRDNTFGPESVAAALDELQKSPAGLDPVLAETLPKGVAYHHAGLTVEERELVELCYRSGIVRVLTATSTLAAGVNLPARRVIFRQPRIGRDFIDGTRYRQMAGRAGRAGIDTKGESILICKPEELKRMSALLNEACRPLLSCLAEDKNGMTRAILEVVAGGIVQTANDVERYVKCTLLSSTQTFKEVVKSAQDSLRWLCNYKFLEWDRGSEVYNSTPLGKAAFGSCLSPEESLVVFDDLAKAREGFVLASDLHLVYQVTPIYVELQPDWGVYYKRFSELSQMDQAVGNRVGVMEPFLMRMAHGAPIVDLSGRRNMKSPRLKGGSNSAASITGRNNLLTVPLEHTLRICKRFYVALILARLIQETPLVDVCDSFKVARGMVQALQEMAGRFASMVAAFCERLGWQDLEGLVSKFQSRVSFGVKAEIVELTEIPYVKASRARSLYRAGFRTPQAVAEATLGELAKALFESSSWVSSDGSRTPLQHRFQMGMVKKIQNGARKLVLDRAEAARVAAFSALRAIGVDVPTALSQPLTLNSNLINKQIEKQEVSAGAVLAQIESFADGLQDSRPHTVSDDNNQNVQSLTDCRFQRSAESGALITNLPDLKKNLPSFGDNVLNNGPVDVNTLSGGFDEFINVWKERSEFFFDLHFTASGQESGSPLFDIKGMAVCWVGSPIFYVSVGVPSMASEKDENLVHRVLEQRWKSIGAIFSLEGVLKVTWDWQVQLKAFKHPSVCLSTFRQMEEINASLFETNSRCNQMYVLQAINLAQPPVDIHLAAWLLWPDEESANNPGLEQEVKKRLPGNLAAKASREGRWVNQMGKIAHNGCCRRVAQIRALHSVIWKLIISEGLQQPLLQQEMPLVSILADMEASGIRVDMDACKHARHLLEVKIRELERKAHELSGVTFSLSVPAEVASVLYTHLRLPIPAGCNKGKQHPSTDKQALDALRDHHPVVEVIKEHRTLSKVLHSTVMSILSKARPVIIQDSHCASGQSIIYNVTGNWLQTSTATGRLSMEEPNLQCVEHSLSFTIMEEHGSSPDVQNTKICSINPRDFFMPFQDEWVLLSADYSQIEIRLMAHFSQDTSLIEILSRPSGDLFVIITARWTGVKEADVTAKQREHTKRLVYGILYGMGVNALAEQLECTIPEAMEKYGRFKSAFPGIAKWLKDAVKICKEKGYISTLVGRKRYLGKIKCGSQSERAKAERQAVNSICQGSAADLIKIAMIKLFATVSVTEEGKSSSGVHTNDESGSLLAGKFRLLLQIHDELVLEVDKTVVKEVAQRLMHCMETAASLRVPLRVKLKYGPRWGTLQPFEGIQ